MLKYKNYQKRFYHSNGIYFITTNTKDGFQYFRSDKLCKILINTIKVNKLIKKFKLFDFVIMYEHLHLILRTPNLKNNISEIMRSIKTNSSREINKFINRNEDRVARPDLHEGLDLPQFRWQERFYDHVIRNDNDFHNHLDYIFQNPLKHLGMEKYEDYKYSSCKFWQELIDDYE